MGMLFAQVHRPFRLVDRCRASRGVACCMRGHAMIVGVGHIVGKLLQPLRCRGWDWEGRVGREGLGGA